MGPPRPRHHNRGRRNMSDNDSSGHQNLTNSEYEVGLLEYVNDAIISMDLELVILSWNQAAERLYGWTADEAIGQHIVKLLRSKYPRDSRATLIETLLRDGRYEGELIHHHKDGKPINVMTSGSVLAGKDGKTVGYVSINRDVTGRQNAEEALRWSSRVFDQLDWGIVIGDKDKLSLVNPAFARMHGYAVEEIVGSPIVEMFAPESREAVPAQIAVAHEKGHHTFESIHIRKDGSRFPVRIHLTAVKDRDGNVLYRAASVFDITEEERSAEALKQGETRYRHMFESASVAMIEVDVSKFRSKLFRLRRSGVTDLREYIRNNPGFVTISIGMIDLRGVNRQAVKLFEAADAEELSRLLIRVFLPETFDSFRDLLMSFAGNNDHFETEAEIVTLKGNRRHIFMRTAFPSEGAPFQHPLVSIFDITTRKRTEEALLKTQFAIDHAADALFWIRPDGRIVEVNDATSRYLGYTREELLSMRITQIDALERDWKTAWEEIKLKGSITVESDYRTRDGRLIPVEIVSNYLDYHGREFNCAFVRDITERKELEAQLRQSQKLETIGTLAGGIAHDFNNILGPILGYTDMLLSDQAEDSEIRNELEQILKAANRAKELVQQILLFSRHGEQERKPVQIQLIVTETLKLLKATFPLTIEVRTEIEPDCGAVLADPTQVHQVLLNLCTNAQHAMREAGGILTVKLNEVEADKDFARSHTGMVPGRYVELTVTDTGPGIDPSSLDRIFEPFFTTKGVGEGTGLGLSVAHGIVVRHGGTVSVESTPGQSTSFHVFFPRSKSEEVEADISEIPLASKSESILYVEDRSDVADVGRSMLEKLGYRVTVALSGIDALEIFRENPGRFEAMVTDQTMPGMSGTELARKILEIRPDLPIVLMTGHSESVTRESAKQLGIRCYLRKPIVTRELAVALRDAIDREPAALDSGPKL